MRWAAPTDIPVIIPTPERVDRMVLASGLDGDVVLGEVGPLGGVCNRRESWRRVR